MKRIIVFIAITSFTLAGCQREQMTGYVVTDDGVSYLHLCKEGQCAPGLDVDADRTSFKPLNRSYGKDASDAFFNGKKIEGADVSTFEALNEQYAKDQRNVYFNGIAIQGAHSPTFEVIGNYEARDQSHQYDGSSIVE